MQCDFTHSDAKCMQLAGLPSRSGSYSSYADAGFCSFLGSNVVVVRLPSQFTYC